MIENKKSIAILLAVYQGARYLDEMLNSLETQTMQDFTCYIHDDGSTDDTLAIIRRHQKQREDQYILIEAADYLGLGAKENFMFLLSQVQSRYYMFADQDDVWLPEKIAKTYQKMQQVEKTATRSERREGVPRAVHSMAYGNAATLCEICHRMLFEHGASAPSPHADKRLREARGLFEHGTSSASSIADKRGSWNS